MSLNVSKLESVRVRGDKTIARCPACVEAGHDQKGEHLFIHADGRFGCVVYPGDSADAKEHRKRIFALCGDRDIKLLSVHPPDLGRSGRLGRPNQSQSASHPLKTGLLGRLGRVNESHSACAPLKTGFLGSLGRLFEIDLGEEQAAKQRGDRKTQKLNDYEKGVLPVLQTHTVAKLPFVLAYSKTLQEMIFLCEDEDTKAALVNAGADEWSIYMSAELQILVQHNRAKPFIPDELLRLHQAKRTFNAQINGNT